MNLDRRDQYTATRAVKRLVIAFVTGAAIGGVWLLAHEFGR